MAIVNLFDDASRKMPRRRASDAAYALHGASLLEREAPLAQLYRAAEAAAEGRGSLVALAGEAGLGKTSLLEAFAKGIAATHAVHWGSCESLITPRPLGALHDISRELSEGLLDQIEQAETRSVIFATLHDCLRLAAKPTVLIFEDVHWADDGTLDLIKFLGRRLKRLPALLVVSFRDDEVDREHPLTRVLGDIPAADQSRVSLQPLSEKAIENLTADSGYTAAELHNISAGNPFFVTELIAVSKHGELDKRSQTQIPRTVSDAVLARASRLNAPAREVLEVVSLAPGKMPLPLVQSILQADAMAGIDQCLERGVLRAVDGGQNVMFRHELARLAIEKSLPLLRRQDTHRAILRAMDEQEAKGTPGVTHVVTYDLARRVHHASGCADAMLVLSLAPRAAQKAAALGAHREAAAHYQSALQFVAQAAPELQAELWESWSYEQSIALQIDEPVIAARHEAIALWQKLGRKDKVGLNLRWLSRLHWYRSERELAEHYANEAITVLESIPLCAELAMAYSLRSQLYMLVDDFDWAIEWGERALGAAQPENAVEVRVHAMTNIATALLLSQRPGGMDMMMQCLALAQQHGMHEHAARVYTNYCTSLLTDKYYSRAAQFLEEGIAYDRAHDLDSWLHYLVGMYAHLKFDLGDYAECERQAQSALAVPRQTSVMRLPAMSIYARLKVRRGDADAAHTLSEALELALPTKEPHRIVALYLAQAELAWAEGDDAGCKAAVLSAIAHSAEQEENIWPLTLLQLWRARCGLPLLAPDRSPAYEKSPYWLEAQGLCEAAARAWKVIGAPFEEGMAWFACGDDAGIARAIEIFARLNARPALEKARAAARKLGVRGIPRGPYAVAREHPLGLTQREVEVLQLLAVGASNAVIAHKLSRSERTVEHHVSALLAKLGAKNRAEAIALAHQHHVV